ncbi:hypothetical protein AMAG_12138 [Allomyces macrogynus ATCC 38327]|uniref:Uncharacterized protein n=1 Tax=Allomyces macrogynus (strain ATCC 38327) TaxID=578462 RepID=A0A0L0SX34_ALLM3|nr:hypothetical protein AMAG_12138 [Allomyces macrogynus ATCC 38327]|eukprot:KNE67062.1 hypothetical protein AMAG_12138 [Allomyces macrogynus ATCC 38327]
MTSMRTDTVPHVGGPSAPAATGWLSVSVIAASVPPSAATAPTLAWESTAVPRTDLPAPSTAASAPAPVSVPAPVAASPAPDATSLPPAAAGLTGFDPSVSYIDKLTEYCSQYNIAMPTFEKLEATSTVSPRFGCRVTYGPDTHRETVASPHPAGSRPPGADAAWWPAHLASLPAWPASPIAGLAARTASVASWVPSLGPAHLPVRPPILVSFDDVSLTAAWGSAIAHARAPIPTPFDDPALVAPVAAWTPSLSTHARARPSIPASFDDTPSAPPATTTPAAWTSSSTTPSVSLPPTAVALIPTLLASRTDTFAALTQVAAAAGALAPRRFATQSSRSLGPVERSGAAGCVRVASWGSTGWCHTVRMNGGTRRSGKRRRLRGGGW